MVYIGSFDDKVYCFAAAEAPYRPPPLVFIGVAAVIAIVIAVVLIARVASK